MTTAHDFLFLTLSLVLVVGAQVPTFPAGMTWQNIAWCPQGYNGKCQNIEWVQPGQRAVDVDLFDTDSSTMMSLRNNNHTVICYFSAGTYENWRPDKDSFPSWILRHEMSDWPGEWWLDIFNSTARQIIFDIMSKRIALGLSKGCQAFEPDNMDCYDNSDCILSFDPNQAAVDQITFNTGIAAAAHQQNAAVGLKNDVDQVKQLHTHFDFAVNEQCQQYQECTELLPFISDNKAVFQVEYQGTVDSVCPYIEKREGSTLFSVKVAADGLWVDCPKS